MACFPRLGGQEKKKKIAGIHPNPHWVISSQWEALGGPSLNQGFSESEVDWEGGPFGVSFGRVILPKMGHPRPTLP